MIPDSSPILDVQNLRTEFRSPGGWQPAVHDLSLQIHANETLAVVGAEFPGGKPGFVLLDGLVTSRFGRAANGEILQDHTCGLTVESPSTGLRPLEF